MNNKLRNMIRVELLWLKMLSLSRLPFFVSLHIANWVISLSIWVKTQDLEHDVVSDSVTLYCASTKALLVVS